jgi:hypothetical protein
MSVSGSDVAGVPHQLAQQAMRGVELMPTQVSTDVGPELLGLRQGGSDLVLDRDGPLGALGDLEGLPDELLSVGNVPTREGRLASG